MMHVPVAVHLSAARATEMPGETQRATRVDRLVREGADRHVVTCNIPSALKSHSLSSAPISAAAAACLWVAATNRARRSRKHVRRAGNGAVVMASQAEDPAAWLMGHIRQCSKGSKVLECMQRSLKEPWLDHVHCVSALHRICKLEAPHAAKRLLQQDKTCRTLRQLLLDYVRQGALEGRHLSMLVWSFATAGLKDGDLLREVSESVRRLQFRDFEPQSFSITAWGFAKLGYKDVQLFRQMASALARDAAAKSSFSRGAWASQHLGNLAWAFGKLEVELTVDVRSMVKKLAEKARCLLSKSLLEPRHAEQILMGFSNLKVQPFEDAGLLQSLAADAQLRRQNVSLLTSMTFSFARWHGSVAGNLRKGQADLDYVTRWCLDVQKQIMEQYYSLDVKDIVKWASIAGARNSIIPKESLHELSAKLGAAARERLARFSGHELGVFANGFARAIMEGGVVGRSGVLSQTEVGHTASALADEIMSRGKLKPAEASRVAWGLAACGFRGRRAYCQLLKISNVERSDARSLSMLLWALATAKVGLIDGPCPDAGILASLRRAALSRIQDYEAIELANVAWALHEHPADGLFAAIATRATTLGTNEISVISRISWALAKWEPTTSEGCRARDAYFDQLSTALGGVHAEDGVLGHSNAQDVANLTWALGTAAKPEWGFDARAWQSLSARILVHCHKMTVVQLCATAWGLAVARTEAVRDTFAAIGEQLWTRRGELCPGEAASALWSLCSSGWPGGAWPLQDVVSMLEPLVPQMAAQDVANVASCLAQGPWDDWKVQSQTLAAALLRRSVQLIDGSPETRPQARHLVVLMDALPQMDGPDFQSLRQYYEKTLGQIQTSWSSPTAGVQHTQVEHIGFERTGDVLQRHGVQLADVEDAWCRRARYDVASARVRCAFTRRFGPTQRTVLAWMEYNVKALDGRAVFSPGSVFGFGGSIELDAFVVAKTSSSKGSLLSPLALNHSRANHAERMALLHLCKLLDLDCLSEGARVSDVTGVVKLYISHFPCLSCLTVINRFATALPGVQMHIAYHNEWFERQRLGWAGEVSVRESSSPSSVPLDINCHEQVGSKATTRMG